MSLIVNHTRKEKKRGKGVYKRKGDGIEWSNKSMWHTSQFIKDEPNGLTSVCGIVVSPLRDSTSRETHVPKIRIQK